LQEGEKGKVNIMNLRDQSGHWGYYVELEQRDNLIKGKSPMDRRKKIVLGTYKNSARACEIFSEIKRAKSLGKPEFELPQD
jgi:hypothetical protein